MRLADGAVRPAYNVQVASACGFVVAIDPVQRRNDRGLAPAIVAQVKQRCGKLPDRLLADTGAMTAADIDHALRKLTPPCRCSARHQPARMPPNQRARHDTNATAPPNRNA